jgi:hypothetical protein
MTDDLVTRLRFWARTNPLLLGEAADEIERLRHDLSVVQSSQALAIASSDLAQHMKARVERAEAERDALRVLLNDAVDRAEWCDKIISDEDGNRWKSYMLAVFLPVPLGSKWSPKEALDAALREKP